MFTEERERTAYLGSGKLFLHFAHEIIELLIFVALVDERFVLQDTSNKVVGGYIEKLLNDIFYGADLNHF